MIMLSSEPVSNPSPRNTGVSHCQFWLSQMLQPGVAFSFRTIQHPEGPLVLLEIPAATNAPVEFDKTAYIRHR